MLPKCRNPECGKEIPEGKTYCDENCLRRHLQIKKEEREVNQSIQIDLTVEAVLKYMGIEKQNFTKDVAYRHWEKFVEFAKNNSGKNWDDLIKPRLRSYVGIDYRYLDDFLESCLSWGTMRLVNGCLIFVGIPEGEK